MAAQIATIDDYIGTFPEDVQLVLEKVRKAIRSAVPKPGEMIKYKMPAITLDGAYVLYFGGWKHHIGIYPVPPATKALEKELAPYRSGKDSVKFPLKQPIPYDLIKRVAAFIVRQRGA